MDEQPGQALVGGRVIAEALGPEQGRPQQERHLLALLAGPLARLEVQEVAPAAAGRVQQGQPEEGRRDLAVAEEPEEPVAGGHGARLAALPVRVLVAQGRVDLVQVVAVGVAHVRAQDPVAPRLVQAALPRARAQAG